MLDRLCAGLSSLCALMLPSEYTLSDVGVETLCALTSLTHLGAEDLDLLLRPPPNTLPWLPSL